MLEIGGGRNPLLSPNEVASFSPLEYVVNDISELELSRLDSAYGRACFDIQAGPPDGSSLSGSFDLVFARMVFEHIRDPGRAWGNVAKLLKPGGVAVSFTPVLFSPPFVVNRLMPERLSQPLLRMVFPRRHVDDIPKFPAYYRWCRASERYMVQRLLPLGFASVEVIPYFGHGYFTPIPVASLSERILSRQAERRNWTALASYAYVIVSK